MTMRAGRWFVAVIAFNTSVGAVQAQAPDPGRQIVTLEEDWIKAVIARDSAAFNRLLAPGFVYTENDHVYTRAQLIKDVITTSDTVTSGRNEDLKVFVRENTAIATGWLVLIGRSGGKPFERRYRYTDTWVHLGGQWRVQAAHDYLKP